MPSNISSEKQKLIQNCYYARNDKKEIKIENWNCFEHIIWLNVIWFTALHIAAIYGAYLCFTDTKILTIFFAVILYHISLFGITAGVHRLWSHRAYKAKLPFRIILGICNSIAYQNSIYEWGRDHRVHHKYTETNADPVNSNRGFFFAHMGWLLCRKHPDVKRIGARIDLSDMLSDPVVAIQHKYYMLSVLVLCFLLPTLIPYYLWSETLWNAYFVAVILRHVLALHSMFLANSVAHMWGSKPYDIDIEPVDNVFVSAFLLGEGYHNFHHTFPYDYSTSQWGWNINLTTFVLDQFAKMGWVYDRRKASKELIKKSKLRSCSPITHNMLTTH